jgi:hypothetical protein
MEQWRLAESETENRSCWRRLIGLCTGLQQQQKLQRLQKSFSRRPKLPRSRRSLDVGISAPHISAARFGTSPRLSLPALKRNSVRHPSATPASPKRPAPWWTVDGGWWMARSAPGYWQPQLTLPPSSSPCPPSRRATPLPSRPGLDEGARRSNATPAGTI